MSSESTDLRPTIRRGDIAVWFAWAPNGCHVRVNRIEDNMPIGSHPSIEQAVTAGLNVVDPDCVHSSDEIRQECERIRAELAALDHW